MFLIYELKCIFKGYKIKTWGWCNCVDIFMKKKECIVL